MMLALSVIFLIVDLFLVLGSMENHLLNLKMSSAYQAQSISLNSAEAEIVALEAQTNGQHVDLSQIVGTVSGQMIFIANNDCQEKVFALTAVTYYQNSGAKITTTYLVAHQPPLPGCSAVSYQVSWQHLDLD